MYLFQNKKSLYAVVCEAIKCQDILLEICSKCPELRKDRVLQQDEDLLVVLLYEHFLGRGIRGKYKVSGNNVC